MRRLPARRTPFSSRCWGQATNPHNLEVAYDKALDGIPDGPAKADGLAWGKHVAEAILAARAKSGFNKPIRVSIRAPSPENGARRRPVSARRCYRIGVM